MLGEISLRHTLALHKFLLTSDALLRGNQGGRETSKFVVDNARLRMNANAAGNRDSKGLQEAPLCQVSSSLDGPRALKKKGDVNSGDKAFPGRSATPLR